MSVERDVGRGIYETWPTGATRAIATLEIKLKEVDNSFSQIRDLLDKLKNKYKPEEIQERSEEDKLWKEYEICLTMMKNAFDRINPNS